LRNWSGMFPVNDKHVIHLEIYLEITSHQLTQTTACGSQLPTTQPAPKMPPNHTPLFRLLTPFLQNLRLSPNASSLTPILPKPTSPRPFSTTPTQQAGGRPGKNDRKSNQDQRIALIRYHLQHPKTPRPLRLSRLRALRHWTIHRAWMLARRKRLEDEEKELYRFVSSSVLQSLGSEKVY
jgi:hypothetical protein